MRAAAAVAPVVDLELEHLLGLVEAIELQAEAVADFLFIGV